MEQSTVLFSSFFFPWCLFIMEIVEWHKGIALGINKVGLTVPFEVDWL